MAVSGLRGAPLNIAAPRKRTRFLGASAALLTVFWATALSAGGEIDIRGAEILRDGRSWEASGLSVVGRTAPAVVTKGYYQTARLRFGAEELRRAKDFGADLIRFQVSQAGSDPRSPIYSAEYINDFKSAVVLARDAGFSVIVCLDSQAPSGLDETGMPSEKTRRAWRSLVPLFADDAGVMLEIFNEPAPTGPDAIASYDWNSWKMTMQPIVNDIRELGAKNILLVDGLNWGRKLKGIPELKDPRERIVYAIHPYYSSDLATDAGRDDNFGNFSENHPVLATEWGAASKNPACNETTPKFAAEMLSYLHQKKIGVVGWAFDYPGTIMVDGPDSDPTTYVGFHCGAATSFGPGRMLNRYFRTHSAP